MIKQKSASIVLFSIVLIISAFAGCSTNNPSGQSTSPLTQPATPMTTNTSQSQQQPALVQITDRMMVRPFDDLKFETLPDGSELAVIAGDPANGPSTAVLKFKSGPIPMHWHPSPYYAVVVRGLAKHWAEGDTEENAPLLGPGSYWFQPPNQVHTDACVDPSGECVIFVHTLGKMDKSPANEPPPATGTETVPALVVEGMPTMGQMIVRPFDDLKFVEWRSPPVPDGKGIAVISGDPPTGPNILMHRFMRDNPSTLHWHSSPYHGVVVRGTIKHWAEGDSEATAPPLGPGSYWFQPANKVHADKCVDAGGECVISLHTLGKLDSTPARPEKR